MSCTYKFANSENNSVLSYKELTDYILKMIDSENLDIDDLVFSRTSGEILYNHTVDKLKTLKQESFKVKENSSFSDSEPSISSEGCISTQELIDSKEFAYITKAKIEQLNRENFIINETRIKQSEGLSKEEAENFAKNEVAHWDQIQEDAKKLHMLISDFNFGKQLFDFEEKTKNTPFEDVSDELYETVSRVLYKKVYSVIKANDQKSVTFNNLNIRVPLEGITEDLLLHMDKVIVDGDGIIHVYNFKTSTTTPDMWDKAKWEKYKIQMALIKRGLESLGFESKNIDLNIIPVKIKYSDNFSEITSAIALNPQQLNIYSKPSGGVVNALTKEYNWAKKLIASPASLNNITSQDEKAVNKQLEFLFLNKNLQLEGIQLTALSWIRHNMKDGGKIKILQDPDYDFMIQFEEDDIVKIPKGYGTNPLTNEKVIEEVKSRTSLLNKNDGDVMQKILHDILKGHDAGFADFGSKQYGRSSVFLDTVFDKYCHKSTDEKGNSENEWKVLENDILTSANILVFQHRVTKQLDFIVLSPYDLKNKTKLKKSDQHILGDHLYTGSAPGKLIDYKPTFGNLEAVRASLVINQVLPKITGEWKLGKLHIVSLERGGQGNIHDLENLNKNLIDPVIKFMNTNPNMEVKNNFEGQKYIDQFQILLDEYKALLDSSNWNKEDKLIFEKGYTQLEDAVSIEAKRIILLDIAEKIQQQFPLLRDVKMVEELSKEFETKNNTTSRANAAELLKHVFQTLRYYEAPEISSIEEKLSSIPRYLTISERLPNKNFQIIQHVYTKAIDNVAANVLKEIEVARRYFKEYYDKCGYSRVQNATLGGQALTFNHLYALDNEGKQTLSLKNPYNMSEDLENYEREFLKKVLFSFNRIRSMMKGAEDKFKFTYEDINSSEYIHYAESTEHFFDIPLERASKSTRIQKNSVKDKLDYTFNRIKDAVNQKKNLYDVFGLDLSDEEIADREDSIDAWQLRNKFDRGEVNRVDVIANHDISYFETNLDKLLTDFTEKYYEHRELNKALMISKAVIFELELLRGLTNDKEVIDQTEEMINAFNKVNIFNGSIMEKQSQQILGAMQPLRNLVSKTLIAGNVVSAFRDSFEGVWQNTMRSLNKFQTNINLVQVMQGYKTVIENSFTDQRSINIVNQLCLKYRLSNIDISRISQGLSTEGGIVNYDDWLYATIRKPDFLNRMVLFIAQCYKDGVYEAFSINDEGALEYDWKKDKRFSIYASGDKSNPEYAKQMGAYYNAVRAYNQDHPEATISFDGNVDPLPEPYSDTEIKQFKQLANSIYGAYDKSTKAMYEYMAIGTVFGMFSTWMNGMYANYFAKPGQYYSSEFKLEQAKNSSGHLLFFDDLGNIIYKSGDKYYYDGTDTEVIENLSNVQPVMDKIPIIVQGIWYSLKDATKALSNHEFKEWWSGNPQDRDNIWKLLTDILMTFLFTTLIKPVLTGKYKEFKKDMVNHPFTYNVAGTIMFKSTSRSFDGFKGPVNMLQFVGENTDPPMYTQSLKLAKESLSAVVGAKPALDVLTGNVAVFKVAQDAYKAEKKK